MTERQLSQRELEQLELTGARAQQAVDEADEHWDEIVESATYVVNAHQALLKLHVPDGIAWGLVPSVIDVFLGRKK